jgi:beta-glucosidase
VVNGQEPAYPEIFLSFEDRVSELVGRMTLEEKASQLLYTAVTIPRLGVTAYS